MKKILFLLIVSSFFCYSQQLTCGAQFTDNGGFAQNYLANSNQMTIICPTNPTDQIAVTFDSFNIEPEFDGLYVYDGLSIAAPQIASNNPAINGLGSGAFWGNTIPGPFIATEPGGCLTFVFKSNNSNQQSGWTANVSCISTNGFTLNSFIDYDGNGIQNGLNEINFPVGEIQYEKNNDGVMYHEYSDFANLVFENDILNTYNFSYVINPFYNNMFQVNTPSFTNITIDPNMPFKLISFPITPLYSNRDLAVTLVPVSSPIAGNIYSNRIQIRNLSNLVTSGTVTFTKDSKLTIIQDNSNLTYNVTGFTTNFLNLPPLSDYYINVNMQVPNIPVVNLGDIVTNSVIITSNDPELTLNNNDSSCTLAVIGSYDPNDITESNGNKIAFTNFNTNDYLHYTIRFENTGTAPANNVLISNILDSQIDEASVQILASSNNYNYSRYGSNIVFKFDNIYLPISQQNNNFGKGFINYKAKLKPGFAVGSIIPNTANIYFDSNPAIVTNTFNTEFVAVLKTNIFESNEFNISPNPALNILTISNKNNTVIKEMTIYNTLGQQVQTIVNPTKNIDVSNLLAGHYLLKIVTDSGERSCRFIKN